MRTRVTLAALTVVALAFVGVEWQAARTARANLAAAKERCAALTAKIGQTETMLRGAEQRAADAERDCRELLKAVAAVRAEREREQRPRAAEGAAASLAASANARESSPGSSSASPMGEDEKRQLAQMRAYQQELAKRRAEEAKKRAEQEEDLRLLEPRAKFEHRMDLVRQYAAQGQFQIAVRVYNQAMAEKPADLAVSEDIKGLQGQLQAQNSPVKVAFVSDGVTFVSVAGVRAPVRFERTELPILPGDYEVVGRRTGFRDVRIMVQIRNGTPLPPITVMCTQPVGP